MFKLKLKYLTLTRRNLIGLTVLSFCSIVLTGCSFYADFYIVNKSDKPVTTIIQFISPIDELKNSNMAVSLRYTATVLTINDKTRDLLTEQLAYEQIDANTVKVDIPEYATIVVAGTYNRAIAADSIKFIVDGTIREYTRETISGHLKKSGGLFPPFHFTYTIEEAKLTVHLQ